MMLLILILIVVSLIIIHYEIRFHTHSNGVWITYERTFNDMGKPHKVKYTKKLW